MTKTPQSVAYLIGAGATHACIEATGSPIGVLMSDLVDGLVKKVKPLVGEGAEFASLRDVVNEIVVGSTDIEQLITFFDESPASIHRRFAEALRSIFECVLRDKFQDIERELGMARSSLYYALLDLYNVNGFNETLSGILTLNYDDYIELALQQIFYESEECNLESVDNFGLGRVNGWSFLKLHGSFAWSDTWPISARSITEEPGTRPLWIPPGIRKQKERYPFNLVWGKARDVLDCDVLRVIGCSLVPGDWDLISLLFGTRHANTESKQPYSIEIIDSLHRANELKKLYPYLNVRSIYELETLDIGKEFVSDIVGGKPRSIDELSTQDKNKLEKAELNWFKEWLTKMWEGLQVSLGPDATETRARAYETWLVKT